MGQEARTTGNTAKPADLRVLRAGGEHKSPLPKDFVAEVERRARAEGPHDPDPEDMALSDHAGLKEQIMVGGGILAALIIAFVLVFVGGSDPDDATGGIVVASDTGGDGDATAMAAGDAAEATADGESGAGAGIAVTAETPDATAPAPTVAGFGGFGADFSTPAITPGEPAALDMTFGELAYHQPATEVILAAFNPEGSVDMPWLNQADHNVSPYWSEAKPATLAVLEISATTAGGFLQDGTPAATTDAQAAPAAQSSDQVLASSDELIATKSATVAAPPKGTRIQLAAYGSEQRANEAWSELQAAHSDMLADLQPMVESALLDSGTFYRLQAGPFGSTDDATAFCQQLLERQLDCIVIPR
ncbi:MAG: SPOR domain-containing protein [Pseudomonadota bacterium]